MATLTLPPLTTNGTAPTAVMPVPCSTPGRMPQAQLTVVTPQMAADWLETAHPNRPIAPSRVRKIAQAIAHGLWQLNGATIVLCPEFRLLDGRHRCKAIVQSGLAVPSMVVAGIDPQAFATMDMGAKRTAGDILQVQGHPQAAHLASGLRWLWRYQNDRMRLSTVEILDYELPGYFAQHPELAASLPYGVLTRALVPQGLGAAFHMLMAAKDTALAQRVFEALARGIGLSADDPVYRIREQFLHDRAPLYHASIVERAALLSLAWYCLRREKPLEAQGCGGKGPPIRPSRFPGSSKRGHRMPTIFHASTRDLTDPARFPSGALVVDTRYQRHTSWPAVALGVLFPGGHYLHVPALGAQSCTNGSFEPTAKVIDYRRGLQAVQAALQPAQPLVVLCHCPQLHSRSHRQLVARELARALGLVDGGALP